MSSVTAKLWDRNREAGKVIYLGVGGVTQVTEMVNKDKHSVTKDYWSH